MGAAFSRGHVRCVGISRVVAYPRVSRKERLKAQIQEVSADVKKDADSQADQQKEILFTKDQEMTRFMNEFDGLKADEEKKLEEKQQNIHRLLENISLTLALTVSPEGHMRDVEDELEFKNKQLQNSESTHTRLDAELMKRQGELDKIESLDVKINQELEQIEAKMKRYEDEIATKFDRITEVQALGSAKMQELETRKASLDERVSSFKQQVSFLKLRCESRKQQLEDDEHAQQLAKQEAKIRLFGQNLHGLTTFIRSKTAESNYEGEMVSCLSLADQLNKLHMERRIVSN